MGERFKQKIGGIMSYTNIKPTEPLKQRLYYKIVQVNKTGAYYGMFTYVLLPKNRWINAISLTGKARNVPNYFNVWDVMHIIKYDFKGFGVFSCKSLAEQYLNSFSWGVGENADVIKVLCKGDVKKADTLKSEIPCYIFDKIKIID